MYNLCIFDLDGTLLDTSEGIIHCYNHIADAFSRARLPKAQFRKAIGGPLLQNFMDYYKMSHDEAAEAASVYRELYAREGVYMAEHYGGMKELLYRLADSGRKTAVATLKRQDLAVKILTEFGLAGAFGVIYGMDENDMLTKSSLICRCVDYFSVRAEEAVLIGDSMNDAVGAQNAGVAFIGVTYGLGFAAGDGNEISAAGGAVARSVGELCGLLFT